MKQMAAPLTQFVRGTQTAPCLLEIHAGVLWVPYGFPHSQRPGEAAYALSLELLGICGTSPRLDALDFAAG
jgi:hypothetical protein